jgi:coenzyme F420 hydrogenase subunit beta
LQAVERKLSLEKLYILGIPCVDNVTRNGLRKFLETMSISPETIVNYDFMQDLRVHFKHQDGSIEKVPFFCLKINKLKDVFATSCMSCLDSVNTLANLVVGYMGAEFSWQWVTVRNETGQEMLRLLKNQLDTKALIFKVNRKQAVQQSISPMIKKLLCPCRQQS